MGFVVVGFILLLSSLIAIFEFYTMKNTVAKIVQNDIRNIDATTNLLNISEEYNHKIISLLQDTTANVKEEIRAIKTDRKFARTLDSVRRNIDYYLEHKSISEPTDYTQGQLTDSVRYTYFAHVYHIAQLQNIIDSSDFDKHEWYAKTFYVNHKRLIGHIKSLNTSAKSAFISHSDSLNEGFRRSLMPCIVAVVIGIILLFLFNYFINFYFLNPLDKISKGIKSYIVTKRSYEYNLTSNDEMQELNDNVRELVTENRKLIKEKNQ